MGVALVNPVYTFLSSTGAPLANGRVQVYLAGSTTPTDTWQDEGLTALNPNPIELDAAGRCTIWADPALTYKFVVMNAGLVVQYTIPDVKGAEPANLRALLATDDGSSMIGYDGGTVQDVLDSAKPLGSYTALRAYTGRATSVRITARGIGGFFLRDDSDVTTADDGGTVLVDADGRRWKRVYDGALLAAWFEAVGDGVADDYAALAAGATAAAAAGIPLVCDGSATYLLGSEWTLPTGLRLQTNGATVTTSLTTTGDSFLLTVGADTVIDELNVHIPTGKRRDCCVLLDGDDIRVGKATISSIDQQANSAASGAFQVLTGARNWVGLLRVANWDRPVVIGETSKSTFGRITAGSYVRGLYLYDNTDLLIQGGKVSTASPNASATAGHNGVLMQCSATDAQRDVTFESFIVEDAGEHGWRIGGPEQQSKLRFSDCSAYNCGGTGFKILGTDSGIPTAINRDITLDNFIAEDNGKDTTGAAQNRAGIVLKFCRDVQVIAPIVRKRNQTYSAQYGLVLDGVDFVHITSPILGDAQYDGLYLQSSDGDCDYVQVTGGLAYANGRYGANISVDAGKTCRHPTIDGMTFDSNVGNGFNVANSGTVTTGTIRARCVGNAGAGACNSTAVTLQLSATGTEVAATPLAGISARNGSWFDDGTTLNIRKAGAWAAL